MKNVREIAAEALLKLDTQNAYSNLALDGLHKKYKLDKRDGAFLSALFYGVLERQTTLDACINAHSKTKIEKLSPAVLTALRIGLYQLLYMDFVPEHAAVDESVQLVKKLRKAQAAGFVNGVLRSFLRGKKAVPVPREPIEERLSVEYSCPVPIVSLWLDAYGGERTLRALRASLEPPPVYLRVNPLKISNDELISRLSTHGIQAVKDDLTENCLVLHKAGAIHELPEFRRGFFHVQDKASQICAGIVRPKEGDRILDACAAPGGKTFTMAQIACDKAQIVACDIYEGRVGLITAGAKRLGIKSVQAKTLDITEFDPELGGFDKILCDVPCSGLGAIRRKPEIKRKNPGDFAGLPDLQYKILKTASQYLKPNGRLIYSTCTLNPAENEEVTDKFLKENPDFEKAGLPDFLGGGYNKTILDEFGADGFFIASMTRPE